MTRVDLPAVTYNLERGSIEVGTAQEASFLSSIALSKGYVGAAIALDNLYEPDFPYQLDRHNSVAVAGFVIDCANGVQTHSLMTRRKAKRYIAALGPDIFGVVRPRQLAA